MQRTLVLMVLFGLAINARSDIFIERGAVKIQYTGQGIERTVAFKEVILRDLDGTNSASVATTVIRGHKLYFVSRSRTRVLRENLRGMNGRIYTVIARGLTESNGVQVLNVEGLLVKGLNTTLPVSASRQLTGPRVFRGAASRVEFDSGEFRLTETSYTRTYSQTETRAANALGEDVETALARIIQRLEKFGYVLTD